MSELLRVSDLRVRFPVDVGLAGKLRKQQAHVDVVHGVSLELGRGKTLAIVGESGSGKTTLAMALCGLAPVQGGEVFLCNERVQQDRSRHFLPDHKRVAMMFQDPIGSLSPRMTVRKLVAEPYKIHAGLTNDSDASALALLAMVGLGEDFADRYPHQLSGGQARRVCLARALASKPELLIADEPTAGLDVSIQGEVLNLLSKIQKELGLGILIITHNLNIVRHVADDMAIMYLGRFLEQGPSAAVFERPRHPYTAALLSANPSPNPDETAEPIELQGEVPGLLQRPSGCEFHTRCPNAQERCKKEFPEREGDDGHYWNCFYPQL